MVSSVPSLMPASKDKLKVRECGVTDADLSNLLEVGRFAPTILLPPNSPWMAWSRNIHDNLSGGLLRRT